MDAPFVQFIIAALAVYRLASMIAYEDGPADVFARLRGRVAAVAWDGKPETWGQHWAARGLSCPLCVSFWLAWPAALLLPWPGPGLYILTALALSAVTVLIVRVVNHD